VRKAAEAIVAEVRGKLPEGLGQEPEADLTTLLDEARLLVLDRTTSPSSGA
jgi:hypothetical protein